MSIPAPSNPLPGTPQEALGLSDNPLPTPRRFPTLGGSGTGRRRRSQPPGAGVASRAVRGGPPGAPHGKTRSQVRADLRKNATIVRPQPKETSSPAPAKASPPQPGRTAAGAPLDHPRRIPKKDVPNAGQAEATRAAQEGSMNKEAAARYHAKPAALQELINDIRRTNYDEFDRRNLANEADFLVEEKYQAQQSKAKSPGVVEAVRRSAKAHREGGASPMARPLQKANEQASPELEGEAPDPATRARRAEQYKKMRETLDQPPPPGLPGATVIDEYPRGRHKLTTEEGDELLRRARQHKGEEGKLPPG